MRRIFVWHVFCFGLDFWIVLEFSIEFFCWLESFFSCEMASRYLKIRISY